MKAPYVKRLPEEPATACLIRAAKDPRTPDWQADSLREEAAVGSPFDSCLIGVYLMTDGAT